MSTFGGKDIYRCRSRIVPALVDRQLPRGDVISFMMNDPYEKEQRRLQRLYEEVLSEMEESDPFGDDSQGSDPDFCRDPESSHSSGGSYDAPRPRQPPFTDENVESQNESDSSSSESQDSLDSGNFNLTQKQYHFLTLTRMELGLT
ncbi:unnamed protein product [Acanthoscelides obtectus]|uniref:Uncharacterized protein n=1 Tax=Acanthoscelides obtectus TaxID=200917 RepID=A0A9P0L3F4_ACAOB|nr:unnamed protein product [Acanthoscelides obtectus]CAK1681043.1 hypothetical protein AOBTE_LOCUS32992 [Acanthoscelides obtectus]